MKERAYQEGNSVDSDDLAPDVHVPLPGEIRVSLDAELVCRQVYQAIYQSAQRVPVDFQSNEHQEQPRIDEIQHEDVQDEKPAFLGFGFVPSEIGQLVQNPVEQQVDDDDEHWQEDHALDPLFVAVEIGFAEVRVAKA